MCVFFPQRVSSLSWEMEEYLGSRWDRPAAKSRLVESITRDDGGVSDLLGRLNLTEEEMTNFEFSDDE